MTAPYNIADLIHQTDAGRVFEYRFFYGHTPRSDGRLSNAVFSQFYERDFEIDGVRYFCSEQWMMAHGR